MINRPCIVDELKINSIWCICCYCFRNCYSNVDQWDLYICCCFLGISIPSKSSITNTSCIKAIFNSQKSKDNFCEVIDTRSNMVFGLRKRQIVRRMTQQKYFRSYDISQQHSILQAKAGVNKKLKILKLPGMDFGNFENCLVGWIWRA